MQVIGYQIVQITEHKINITHRSMLDKLDRMPLSPRSDDLGPRRSPAFYWAGFLSHLVSNFKKRCRFGPFQSPFRSTVQCPRLKVLNCGVQSSRRECAHSKAFCLSTENIAWRWLQLQMVRDVRGTLTAPSPHSSCLGN